MCERDHQILSSSGKCYDCRLDVSYGCDYCNFTKNEFDSNEKLVCIDCRAGYYLDSEGKCINYLPNLKRIPFCYKHKFHLKNNILIYYTHGEEDIYYDYLKYPYNGSQKIDNKIETECIECETGYFLNGNNICESINIEECSIISIFENYPIKYYECKNFCYLDKNTFITSIKINLNNLYEVNDNEEGEYNNVRIIYMDDIIYSNYYYSDNIYSILDDDIKSLTVKSKLCISNSGKGGENDPANLRKFQELNIYKVMIVIYAFNA